MTKQNLTRAEVYGPKSSWGPGPWQDEPDRLEWTHAGLYCLMIRNDLGSWCGYVGVPPEHPLHGIHHSSCAYGCQPEPYRDLDEITGIPEPESMKQWRREHPNYDCAYEKTHSPGAMLEVHGGITWSDFSDTLRPGQKLYWFGFDCGHAGDYSPGMKARLQRIMPDLEPPITYAEQLAHPRFGHPEIYRDVPYVKAETTALAEQLAAIKILGLRGEE
jgi:hypothetical protein